MKRLWCVVLSCLLLCGCAVSSSTEAAEFAPPEEQRLCLYTCLEESVYAPLVQEFQERTGIWVEVLTGSSPELMDWLENPGEKRVCDVVLGCTGGLLESHSDSFAPLNLPDETVRTDGYPMGSRWASVTLEGVVLVYNPKLLRQNLPTGLLSLTDPAWQGKVGFADPEQNDFSQAVLEVLSTLSDEGDRVLSALAGNLSAVQPDMATLLDRVADGTDYLAVVPESQALRRMADGRDLSLIYPEEGLYLVPEGAAISAGAPHPDNAQAFLIFLLSEDAQNHALTAACRRSVLADLSELPEDARFLPFSHQGTLTALWKQLWEEAP